MGSLISQVGQASVAAEPQTRASRTQHFFAVFKHAGAKEAGLQCSPQGSFQVGETEALLMPCPPGLQMNMNGGPLHCRLWPVQNLALSDGVFGDLEPACHKVMAEIYALALL